MALKLKSSSSKGQIEYKAVLGSGFSTQREENEVPTSAGLTRKTLNFTKIPGKTVTINVPAPSYYQASLKAQQKAVEMGMEVVRVESPKN